jgi:hypothetical protein
VENAIGILLTLTYQAAYDVAREGSGRKCGYNGDSTIDGLRDSIFSSEFAEGRNLVLHEGSNRLDSMATLELHSEWMLG